MIEITDNVYINPHHVVSINLETPTGPNVEISTTGGMFIVTPGKHENPVQCARRLAEMLNTGSGHE